MNNKTASAPSKTISPTEMTLIKCSLNGHVSKRSWGTVTFASDFSVVRVSLSDCIKDAILRWLISHSGHEGERRSESYVMKRATVNSESQLLRKTPRLSSAVVTDVGESGQPSTHLPESLQARYLNSLPLVPGRSAGEHN